jgi:two-component system, sensor histidine kinase and response regulator
MKPKILVVDDNESNRALARATLEDEGWDTVLAANGPDALETFSAQRPDCVLLDVRLPGMDGFEVCERIRQLPGGAETPVLFLTALRDVDTFDRALKAGGDDFLSKPFDTTELVVRVRTVLKLSRMNTELREYYDLVRRQRDSLRLLQLQKERLTSFVVHDLKNPVNALDLRAQLLLRDRELSDPAKSSVEGIRNEARALLRLILNLLDISKSDDGQLVARVLKVDLQVLGHEVLDTLELTARTSGVILSTQFALTHVWADPDLLRRILENLLDNAVRHAPRGSVVIVGAARAPSGAAELWVADRGPGVAPELRERVFERFVQLESGDRLVRSGRGLGLAFCKLAVAAHGGSIGIEDNQPGAIFRLALPQSSEP